MQNWFECNVRYRKTMEDGNTKTISEKYLIDSLSFAEAEARIIEELSPSMSDEYAISDIKRAKLSDVFFNDYGDRFYKIKANLLTLDGKSGKEKKVALQMLAQASTLKEAIEVFEAGMKGTVSDYEIVSVAETQIVDVFVHEAETEPDNGEASTGKPAKKKEKQLPKGKKTDITVKDKQYVVDKTGPDTIVTPKKEGACGDDS